MALPVWLFGRWAMCSVWSWSPMRWRMGTLDGAAVELGGCAQGGLDLVEFMDLQQYPRGERAFVAGVVALASRVRPAGGVLDLRFGMPFLFARGP